MRYAAPRAARTHLPWNGIRPVQDVKKEMPKTPTKRTQYKVAPLNSRAARRTRMRHREMRLTGIGARLGRRRRAQQRRR